MDIKLRLNDDNIEDDIDLNDNNKYIMYNKCWDSSHNLNQNSSYYENIINDNKNLKKKEFDLRNELQRKDNLLYHSTVNLLTKLNNKVINHNNLIKNPIEYHNLCCSQLKDINKLINFVGIKLNIDRNDMPLLNYTKLIHDTLNESIYYNNNNNIQPTIYQYPSYSQPNSVSSLNSLPLPQLTNINTHNTNTSTNTNNQSTNSATNTTSNSSSTIQMMQPHTLIHCHNNHSHFPPTTNNNNNDNNESSQFIFPNTNMHCNNGHSHTNDQIQRQNLF